MHIRFKPRVTGLFAKVNIVTKTQFCESVRSHLYNVFIYITHTNICIYLILRL